MLSLFFLSYVQNKCFTSFFNVYKFHSIYFSMNILQVSLWMWQRIYLTWSNSLCPAKSIFALTPTFWSCMNWILCWHGHAWIEYYADMGMHELNIMLTWACMNWILCWHGHAWWQHYFLFLYTKICHSILYYFLHAKKFNFFGCINNSN